MDLSKFAELISLNDNNVAKNTLSYLIGNGYKNDEWGEALAGLYNSFPVIIKSTKEDKKNFLPIIIKYFVKYKLSNENISIYNEYEEIIPAKDRNNIKELNPDWNWKDNDIIFKNSNDFTKSLSENSRYNNRFKFIEKYQNQFDNLLKNQKDKMLLHFENKNIWYNLISENYIAFIALCEKLNIDRLEILKKAMTYRAISNIYFKDSDLKNFEKYLDDIYEIKESFEDLISDNKYHTKQSNLFNLLLRTIHSKDYKSAIMFIKKFEKEFASYFKLFDVELNELLSVNKFKEIITKKIEFNKNYGSYELRTEISLLNSIIKDDNWLKFLANYELFNEINIENKKKQKQIKI